eukprot:gene23930-biopygen10398
MPLVQQHTHQHIRGSKGPRRRRGRCGTAAPGRGGCCCGGCRRRSSGCCCCPGLQHGQQPAPSACACAPPPLATTTAAGAKCLGLVARGDAWGEQSRVMLPLSMTVPCPHCGFDNDIGADWGRCVPCGLGKATPHESITRTTRIAPVDSIGTCVRLASAVVSCAADTSTPSPRSRRTACGRGGRQRRGGGGGGGAGLASCPDKAAALRATLHRTTMLFHVPSCEGGLGIYLSGGSLAYTRRLRSGCVPRKEQMIAPDVCRTCEQHALPCVGRCHDVLTGTGGRSAAAPLPRSARLLPLPQGRARPPPLSTSSTAGWVGLVSVGCQPPCPVAPRPPPSSSPATRFRLVTSPAQGVVTSHFRVAFRRVFD